MFFFLLLQFSCCRRGQKGGARVFVHLGLSFLFFPNIAKACLRSSSTHTLAFFPPAADSVKRLTAEDLLFLFFFCRPRRIYYLTEMRQLLLTLQSAPLPCKSLIIFIFLVCCFKAAVKKKKKMGKKNPISTSLLIVLPEGLSPADRSTCLQSPVSPSTCALSSRRRGTSGFCVLCLPEAEEQVLLQMNAEGRERSKKRCNTMSKNND